MENGIFEFTNFLTKDNLSTLGLSLIVGAAVCMIVVQAFKSLIDDVFKKLSKLPLLGTLFRKAPKTKNVTTVTCLLWTEFMLHVILGYAYDRVFLVLLVVNAAFLVCITRGGYDKFLKGITIRKENVN